MKPGNLNEKSYSGNIGFEEMARFYQEADNKKIKKMERIIKSEDWEAFKLLIRKVLDVSLK